MRYPIALSYKNPFKTTQNSGENVLRFFNPLFQFLEDAISKGENVLIHCFAGAHRAGSSGVAWLMYKHNLGVKAAIDLAKSKRPQINPIGSFPELLEKLEIALVQDGLLEKIR